MAAGLRCVTLAAAACFAGACAGVGIGGPDSPRERYLRELRTAGLDAAALGQDWIRAGDEALRTATPVQLPFRETGYWPPERPSAVAYALTLQRGRRLAIELSFVSAQPGRVFVDLFEQMPGAEVRHVASLERGASTLTYDVARTGAYLLRLQPELLRGGRYTIIERTLSSLRLPLEGVGVGAIQSGFGAPRDDRTRDHEGVDIFARRGTPVLAVVDGIATPDTNVLGGIVVWLGGRWGGRRFYYAHLDRWAHDRPTPVRAGDVIGYVGNTGNARTTAPHLHFGIYDDGAIDPLPFLQPDDPVPAEFDAPEELFGRWVRTTASRTPLRPGARSPAPLRQLDRDSVARVTGAAGGSLRVTLPDGSVGYIDARAVEPAERALRTEALALGTTVYELPSSASPIVHTIDRPARAQVLGRFGDFDLVRLTPATSPGWIERAARRQSRALRAQRQWPHGPAKRDARSRCCSERASRRPRTGAL